MLHKDSRFGDALNIRVGSFSFYNFVLQFCSDFYLLVHNVELTRKLEFDEASYEQKKYDPIFRARYVDCVECDYGIGMARTLKIQGGLNIYDGGSLCLDTGSS